MSDPVYPSLKDSHGALLVSSLAGPVTGIKRPIKTPVKTSFKFMGQGLVFLCLLISGFVMTEPAPYELLMVGIIVLYVLSGLKFSRSAALILALLILYNIGGLLSLLTMDGFGDAPLYIAVSLFLGLTSVFFAALIEDDYKILPLLFNAYVVSALMTGLLGILGYFDIIPSSDIFTRYGRAKGAFEDPNVFGPFMVPCALYLMHGLINRPRPLHRINLLSNQNLLWVARLVGLLILTFAIFLSFSRAAWGLYAICSLALIVLLLTRQRTILFRLQFLRLSLFALVLLIVALIIVLQIDAITEILATRAQLVQPYDGAHDGRFARHAVGFAMALEHPFGIGPLEFGKMLGEDPHNIFLKSLMAYGWLGLFSYLALISTTFYFGFRYMLRERPWQVFFMIAMIALFGHTLIGIVIDTDHWRHFYLLLGIAWGCIALEHKYGARLN